ncbi:MAG: hypothetical protein KAY24_05515 [Candidatus Eisenbacteria sp.]|nr:hypothetical protein [Candidatus Eisenbacteria bacterium]
MNPPHRFPLTASLVTAALLILALAASFVQASAGAISRDEAVAITTDMLLGGSTDGVRLFVYPHTIQAGTVVSTWKRDVFTAPAEGWFLFVDLMPAANWEHPCHYVFIDAQSGELAAHDAFVPPAWQDELVEITDGRDNPPPGVSERLLAEFNERLKHLRKPELPSRGRAFAFIISGGANQGNNHIRYWNDCSFIYSTLVNYYGYADENIYVCISDGLDPAPDRSDGTNSPPDLDGDGDDDIQYPATREYIELVFNELVTVLTTGDQLFIFTTDHGGSNGGWDTYLNLWNWEELQDYELADYVDALPCETVIGVFEQCFSGGMIDNLETDGRVLASASRYDQSSWAMPPDYIWDEFVYYWTSAVAWSDPYGNPVDADTNSDGIVSMHEAFIYAEEHDTAAENPQYSSTPPELGDVLNLYGNLEGVYLILDEVMIDDDMEGASHGDGDGVIEFGETIELTLSLLNMGMEDASDVTGTISIESAYIGLPVSIAYFGAIPSGETGSNAEPFVFHVTYVVPDGELLEFTLDVSEDPGTLGFELTAHAPAYLVGVVEIDDTLGGNGDGIPNPGETLELTLAIDNQGSSDSPNVEAVLGTASSYFMPDGTPHPLGVLQAGQGVVEGGFTVEVSLTCPEIYSHYLRLHLIGPEYYQAALQFVFAVGQIFADDMEMGAASWAHYAGPGSWNDEWHLETYRNHTPEGEMSWKCGGAGAGDYGNLLYAILETAEFDLPAGAHLAFWHWISAETSQAHPDHCYDGGLLEISTDGGSIWEPLTPEGGYPYLIRDGSTLGPFPAETPVWSGQQDWTEVIVDLSSYAGLVKLRWAFGSDGAAVDEGWYIDDVRVCTTPPSALDREEVQPQTMIRPLLFPARPNPMATGGVNGIGDSEMILRFALPEATQGNLSLFDATGRLIRVLAVGPFGPGEHQVNWDGRDAAGGLVSAGSYYCRLSVSGVDLTRKVTVLR